ncbi:MAG: 4-(cytidine 5'-diphospho)-2-C-methyl-D-erythritol kinase [Rhodobacteraceae bacterium]|nr:4-(cytidine 5'-diphospho)-2-C-methyl-D-erythritol kinase [Paracoccaceae bacterium]MCF8513026.1 4-(cytidine 5'-diphospho)-2-C-methyl-D-erythritol kinase [Paracoccaceae bacterium]MCF8517271.1 4-(cytidine 5'-diphospho)-2-C-methyl-D-erythritol kinase [Paracoccaceae bacterium]
MAAALVTETARAKINLCLHVTGRRADGYHLLDSLVGFADFGDEINVAPAKTLSLSIEGPQAEGLSAGDDNLVLRAARFLDPQGTAEITLIKRLPVASGIGGGSADAAATLRALSRLWNIPLPAPEHTAKLGADVPACLMGLPLRMQGIGEVLSAAPPIPALDLLLVNPGVAVATPAVFSGLCKRDNPALAPSWPPFVDAKTFCDWLACQRNDLQPPAIALAPVIGTALALLRDTDCLFAGMSGSGATCFALYPPDGRRAKAAKALVHARQPNWWAVDGRLS